MRRDIARANCDLYRCLRRPSVAQADAVADFFKGKQLRMIVGSAVGGGYDLYARALARELGKHIPGEPSIIVQNQPGAAGMVMVNQIYNQGPHDGTVIGASLNGIPTASMLQTGAKFDPVKLNWLGSLNREAYVAYVWHTAPISHINDLKNQGSPCRRDDGRHHHGRLSTAAERSPRATSSRSCAATKARRRSTSRSSAAKSRAMAVLAMRWCSR